MIDFPTDAESDPTGLIPRQDNTQGHVSLSCPKHHRRG
jgi:hypothetical protein